jgi:hypothetical protein
MAMKPIQTWVLLASEPALIEINWCNPSGLMGEEHGALGG